MAEYRPHPKYDIRVGDDGTVLGVRGKPLKPRISNCGYCRVVVYMNGKHTSVSIHRLVADVFLLEGVKEQVNHKDGNKTNNAVSNLEWVTRSENAQHAVATGLSGHHKNIGHTWASGEKNGRAKITVTQVKEIRSKYSCGYARGVQPWKFYGISNFMFRSIIRGNNWQGA